MRKKELWAVIGPKPELLTLLDGRVVSVPPGHPPIEIRLDARFSRLRQMNRLRRVIIMEAEEPAPEPKSAPASERTVDAGPLEAEQPPVEDVPISELGLSSAAEELLLAHGYESLADLREATDKELLAIDGIGPSRLEDVRAAVSDFE